MDISLTLEGAFPWGFRLEGSGTTEDPVKVSKIINGSRAAVAGLHSGDVIRSVNGRPLTSLGSNDVMKILRDTGSNIRIQVSRGSTNSRSNDTTSTSRNTSSFVNSSMSEKTERIPTASQIFSSENLNSAMPIRSHKINGFFDSRTNTPKINQGLNKTGNNIDSSRIINSTISNGYDSENNDTLTRKPRTENTNSRSYSPHFHDHRDTLQKRTNDKAIVKPVDSKPQPNGLNDDFYENNMKNLKPTTVSNLPQDDEIQLGLPKLQVPTITLLKMTRAGKENLPEPEPTTSKNSAFNGLYHTSNPKEKFNNSVPNPSLDKEITSHDIETNVKVKHSASSPLAYRTKAQMTADWVLYGSETSRSIESDLSLAGNSEITSSILPKDDSGYSDFDGAQLASPVEASSEASTPRIALPSDRHPLKDLKRDHSEIARKSKEKSEARVGLSHSARKESQSGDAGKRIQVEGDRRLVIYEGIGPTDSETGVPMAPRNSVDPKNQREWYKCMYRSMHSLKKSQDDEDYPFSALHKNLDRSKSTFESGRRHSTGFALGNKNNLIRAKSTEYISSVKKSQSSPSSPRLSTASRPGTAELSSTPTSPRGSWKPADAKYERVVYRNQPNDVQDYIPGIRSSLTSPRLTSPPSSSSHMENILNCRNDVKSTSHLRPNYVAARKFSNVSDNPERSNASNGHQRIPSNCSSISVFSQSNGGPSMPQVYSTSTSPVNAGNQGMRKAVALYCYKATNSSELSFEKNDTVYLHRKLDRTWYEGESGGRVGRFPASYVKVLPAENISEVCSVPSGRESRMSSFSVDVRETVGQVIHDFMAQSSRELSLRTGETVSLWRKLDKNWYEGSIGARHGIFPVQCISLLPDESQINDLLTLSPGSRSRSSSFVSDKGTWQQVPLGYTRISPNQQNDHSNPTDITYRESQNKDKNGLSGYELYQNNKSGGGKVLGSSAVDANQNYQNFHDRENRFTAQHQGRETCRVLYSYIPQDGDELELRVGDVVVILDRFDDGWCLGQSQRTQRRGAFPNNYVQIIR